MRREFVARLVKEAKDIIARDFMTDGDVSAEKWLYRAFDRAIAHGRWYEKQYAWEKLFVVVFAAAFTACTLVWALLHL